MTEDRTYNGWTNYETWSVALVIDSAQDHRERVQRCAAAWDVSEADRPDYFTRSEAARYTMADALKDWVTNRTQERVIGYEDATDPFSRSGRREPNDWSMLAQQLLGGALSEVNWSEIADNWLSEIDGYETIDAAKKKEART